MFQRMMNLWRLASPLTTVLFGGVMYLVDYKSARLEAAVSKVLARCVQMAVASVVVRDAVLVLFLFATLH